FAAARLRHRSSWGRVLLPQHLHEKPLCGPRPCAAGMLHLRERVRRLAARMRSGTVAVEVHLDAVLPGDAATHARIAALRPFIVYYSHTGGDHGRLRARRAAPRQ
ncbi:unnamed protein product, partial [Phaeothamnion confervicola]